MDFGKDGTYEYTEYLNGVGPLQGGQILIVSLPEVTFTEAQLGSHEVKVTVDVTDAEAPGHGCSEAWGCIAESGNPTSNDRTQTITVTRPEIILGSFLVRQINRKDRDGNPDYSYLSALDTKPGDREIKDVIFNGSVQSNGFIAAHNAYIKDVALYWTGTKVDMRSCTGSTVDKNGTVINDFNGQPQRSGSRLDRRQIAIWTHTNDFDIYIDEPADDNYHLYTITCDTLAGGSVTDSILINNGADVSDLVVLNPDLLNLSVEKGETVSSIPFTVTNNSQSDITDYDYSFTIDGAEIDRSTVRATLSKSRGRRISANTSWTAPDRVTTVPMKVCVTHTGMTGSRCASAVIDVVAPETQCSDGIDNDGDGTVDMSDGDCTDPTDDSEAGAHPTITASPTLVRKGDEVTVTWSNVGPGCTLSAKLAGEDATTEGSATFTATGESTLTVTCGSYSDSVTVKVLPELYET
jgi:hypothetical protein